jgi:hypothetical protein
MGDLPAEDSFDESAAHPGFAGNVFCDKVAACSEP